MYFFFFNDTATTEIYTLSLHDALPICMRVALAGASSSSLASPPPCWRHFHSFSYSARKAASAGDSVATLAGAAAGGARSEEHTSELQSQSNIVCRLLLEKKKDESAISE